MDGKNIALFVAGLLVGAALSWFAARAFAPTPGPPATVEAKVPSAEPKVPAPKPPAPPTIDATSVGDLKTCQATLDKIQSAYSGAVQDKKNNEEIIGLLEELVQKSGADTPDGHPMEWPEIELGDVFKPEGFKAALDKLKKSCPDQFPAGAVADCSEFPCAIQQTVDESEKSWDTKACPEFKEMFGNSTSTWGTGKDDNMHVMHVVPVPDDKEARDYLKEHEGNARKRSRARLKDYEREYAKTRYDEPCKGGDAKACMEMANAYKGDDATAADYLNQSCKHGEGSACNNLAWQACHDRGECDDDSLENARRATELKPEDGQGAWDTYAYVLCQRGDVGGSNAAYRRSCDAGYAKNCDKTCQR